MKCLESKHLHFNFRFGRVNDRNGWIYYTRAEECKNNSILNLGTALEKSFAECAKYDTHDRGYCAGTRPNEMAQGLSCFI